MQKHYQIEWRPKVIPNRLGLQSQDIEDAKELFGDRAFALNRGNEYIPGLFYIDQPRIEVDNYGGIDFPCMLKNDKVSAKGTIMIIGEAPRRKEYGHKDGKRCSLGTPYGIQFADYPDQCWVYKQIFKSLLDEGYMLYLTDAMKLWMHHTQADSIISYEDNRKMLDDEIHDVVNPVKIITFGSVARTMVKQVRGNVNQTPLCHLYHPSQTCFAAHWSKQPNVNYICDIPPIALELIQKEEAVVDMFQ